MWSPPMCTLLRRVAGLHVELAGRLGHLLEHELRVELDHVAVHLLPGLGGTARPPPAWRTGSPISETIRRQPRSSTAIASADRISYRGIVLTNIDFTVPFVADDSSTQLDRS